MFFKPDPLGDVRRALGWLDSDWTLSGSGYLSRVLFGTLLKNESAPFELVGRRPLFLDNQEEEARLFRFEGVDVLACFRVEHFNRGLKKYYGVRECLLGAVFFDPRGALPDEVLYLMGGPLPPWPSSRR